MIDLTAEVEATIITRTYVAYNVHGDDGSEFTDMVPVAERDDALAVQNAPEGARTYYFVDCTEATTREQGVRYSASLGYRDYGPLRIIH